MRRRLIALLAAMGFIAVLLGSTNLSIVSAQDDQGDPTGNFSEAELIDQVEHRPADRPGGILLAVVTKPGKEVDFSKYGESTSGVGNSGSVFVKNAGQVRRLMHDKDLSRVTSTVGNEFSEPASLGAKATPITTGLIQNPISGSETGGGTTIAILDTGFDTSESRLTNSSKIVKEYCVTTDASCPGGTNTSSAAGASDWGWCDNPNETGYPYGASQCWHGTAVAETAAGYSPGNVDDGVAHGANLVLIRVAQYSSGVVQICNSCVVDALNWLYTNRNTISPPLVAVNMSISAPGGGNWSSPCTGTSFQSGDYNAPLDNFRLRSILPVVASGNKHGTGGLGAVNTITGPACQPQAFSVTGSTGNGNNIDPDADVNGYVKGAAPFHQSFNIGGTAGAGDGTSFSSPAVAGAVAQLAKSAGVNSTTPPSGLYSANNIEAALRYGSSTKLPDIRTSCACWTINEVDATQANSRLREIYGKNTSQVNLFRPFVILDTRTGFGMDEGTTVHPLDSASGAKTIDLSKVVGFSSAQMLQVMLNITVYDASTTGFLAVGSGTVSGPTYKHLDYYNGMPATTTMVMATRSTGGIISIYLSAGTANLSVQVLGVTGASTDTHVSTNPTKVIDTSTGTGHTPIAASSGRTFDISGTSPIPSNAIGAYGQLRVDNSGNATTSVIYAKADGASNVVPNVSVDAGKIKENFAVIPFDGFGNMAIYNAGASSVEVQFYVNGWILSGDTDFYLSTPANILALTPATHEATAQFTGTAGGCSSSDGRVINTTLQGGANADAVTIYDNLIPNPVDYYSVFTAAGKQADNAGVIAANNTYASLSAGSAYYVFDSGSDANVWFDVMGCLSH